MFIFNRERLDDDDRFREYVLSTLFIILILCVISTTMSWITMNKVNNLPIFETVPETTIGSIGESTAAPVTIETSMPETEETIHIEETEEPTTVPTVEPTTEPTTKATSAPVIAETTPVVDPADLELLACVIYQEAGGDHQCDDCRRYVADVVLNRVAHKSFPNTIKGVLTQQGQYGSFYYTGVKWPARAKYDVEKHAVERAYRIAEEVLLGNHSNLYGNGYIWQAQFVQGTSGFWCCGHWYGK